jgi:hypothetical protein
MAKPASYKGERGINTAGAPAEFLKEEEYRGRLPSRALVTPRPEFVQPDSGAHNQVAGSLDVHYNVSARPMKYGNFEKDLDGGLYGS